MSPLPTRSALGPPIETPFSSKEAVAFGLDAGDIMSRIVAQPEASAAAAAIESMSIFFIECPSLLLFRVGVVALGGRGAGLAGLGALRRARGRRGRGSGDDAGRLGNGFARLLHVALVVLDGLVLGGGLVGLRLLGGGGVFRLLLLGRGLGLLVGRRGRRDLRPCGAGGERECEEPSRGS